MNPGIIYLNSSKLDTWLQYISNSSYVDQIFKVRLHLTKKLYERMEQTITHLAFYNAFWLSGDKRNSNKENYEV